MNQKKLTPIIISLAIALCLPGCGKSGTPIKAGPPPSGPVELKLKWAVGSHLMQSIDLQQTSETFVPGTPAPIKQDMTMTQNYDVSVVRELSGGGYELEMKFISMRLNAKQGNQLMIDFDSSKEASNPDPAAAALQKLIGLRLQLFLNTSNDVWKIDGTEDLQKRLADAGSDPTGMLTMFNEDMFKQMLSFGRNLPPKPVEPGDSWPVRSEISMGPLGKMMTDYTYTLKSWERRRDHNCARIEFDGTMESEPGHTGKIAGMNLTVAGDKSSGETWFDLEQGMFVETIVHQNMTLYIAVPDQGGGNAGTPGRTHTVTNVLSQTITVKFEPK